MSPAVIKATLGYQMLYRRVLDRVGDASTESEYEDRSVIALADSSDGLQFIARETAALTPPKDLIGLEDPTIVPYDDEFLVFYTGWSGWAASIASLLWARGPSLDSLVPKGLAIAPTPPEHFIKEAEYHRGLLWCELDFIETHEHSRIAVTQAATPLGPWPHPRIIAEPRRSHWDAVNVSTGPLIEQAGRLYMFYNGMVRTDDPNFVHAARIGLLELNRETGDVLRRSSAPVLEPPSGSRIAFAASIAADILYYTVDDREIWAARLDRSALKEIELA